MRKYGESKTNRIMMANVPHVISGWDLENFRPMDFCWHECTSSVPQPNASPRAPPLTDRRKDCPKISETNYQFAPRIIPE